MNLLKRIASKSESPIALCREGELFKWLKNERPGLYARAYMMGYLTDIVVNDLQSLEKKIQGKTESEVLQIVQQCFDDLDGVTQSVLINESKDTNGIYSFMILGRLAFFQKQQSEFTFLKNHIINDFWANKILGFKTSSSNTNETKKRDDSLPFPFRVDTAKVFEQLKKYIPMLKDPSLVFKKNNAIRSETNRIFKISITSCPIQISTKKWILAIKFKGHAHLTGEGFRKLLYLAVVDDKSQLCDKLSINVDTDELPEAKDFGKKGMNGAYLGDGKLAYLARRPRNEVNVIDLETKQVTKSEIASFVSYKGENMFVKYDSETLLISKSTDFSHPVSLSFDDPIHHSPFETMVISNYGYVARIRVWGKAATEKIIVSLDIRDLKILNRVDFPRYCPDLNNLPACCHVSVETRYCNSETLRLLGGQKLSRGHIGCGIFIAGHKVIDLDLEFGFFRISGTGCIVIYDANEDRLFVKSIFSGKTLFSCQYSNHALDKISRKINKMIGAPPEPPKRKSWDEVDRALKFKHFGLCFRQDDLGIELPDRKRVSCTGERGVDNGPICSDCDYSAKERVDPEELDRFEKTFLSTLPSELRRCFTTRLGENVVRLQFDPTRLQMVGMCVMEREWIKTLSSDELNDVINRLGVSENIAQLKALNKIFEALPKVALEAETVTRFSKIVSALTSFSKSEPELYVQLMTVLRHSQFDGLPNETGMSLILKKGEGGNRELPHDLLQLLALYIDEEVSLRSSSNIAGESLVGPRVSVNALKGQTLGRLILASRHSVTTIRELERICTRLSTRNVTEINKGISGVILGQSNGNEVYIRELLQNVHDAGVGVTAHVESSYDATAKEFVTSVRDYVGIDRLETIVKYLLNPDSSSKAVRLEGQEVIGMFGKGFFTVFDGADAVRITTGLNGAVYDMRLSVRKEGGQFVLTIEQFDLCYDRSGFRGTIIERRQKMTNPQAICLAKLKSRFYLKKYACGFRPEEMKVYDDQGNVLNEVYRKIEEAPIPGLGVVQTFLHRDREIEPRNIVTVGGSYLATIGNGNETLWLKYVPEIYRKAFLERGGVKIELPNTVRVTSGRYGILESYSEPVAQAVALAVLRTMVTLYRKEGVAFPPNVQGLLSTESRGISVDQVPEVPFSIAYLEQNKGNIHALTLLMYNLKTSQYPDSLRELGIALIQAKQQKSDATLQALKSRSPGISRVIDEAYGNLDKGVPFDDAPEKDKTREILAMPNTQAALCYLYRLSETCLSVLRKHYHGAQIVFYEAHPTEKKGEQAWASSGAPVKIWFKVTKKNGIYCLVNDKLNHLLAMMVEKERGGAVNAEDVNHFYDEFLSVWVHEFSHTLEINGHFATHSKGDSESFKMLMSQVMERLIKKRVGAPEKSPSQVP